MAYNREASQVQRAILRAGDGAEAVFKTTGGTDPITGFPDGTGRTETLNFVSVNYSREDIANPSLANGMLKILVSPLKLGGEDVEDFVSLIESKGLKVTLPDGKKFTAKYSQITRADGVTPILARVFLGA